MISCDVASARVWETSRLSAMPTKGQFLPSGLNPLDLKLSPSFRGPLSAKIAARQMALAEEILAWRQGVATKYRETAKNLQVLAIWTHAKSDPDLGIIQRIYADLSGLPVGSEREFWATSIQGAAGGIRRSIGFHQIAH